MQCDVIIAQESLRDNLIESCPVISNVREGTRQSRFVIK